MSAQTDIDVMICLHGVGGNFYSGSMFDELWPMLDGLGIHMLRVNTRGHDGIHTTANAQGVCRQGAAYERVDESRWDVAAWLDLARTRGLNRPGLLGHSLGAIKAVYSQAHEPHDDVAGLLALSPPRLSCQAFQNGERGSAFFESLTAARAQVEADRPEALIEVSFPFPLVISAGTFVDKYGPGERYNILEFVDRLTCPTLFTYGGGELEHGGIAFAGLPDAIGARTQAAVSVETIAGADHHYAGLRDVLAGRISTWLITNCSS